jgi:hypothetical protein
LKPLTWKLEQIGVMEFAWVARHTEGDVEFELYVSDGSDGEPGLCDASPSESVWHAWVACGDDVVQTDTWMGETGFAPTNLPEAIVRAERYLLDEMTPLATAEQIAAARTLWVGDRMDVCVHDDARSVHSSEGIADEGDWIQAWVYVSNDAEFDAALSESIEREQPVTDPEYPITSRGSASEVVCEVCDAIDHATEAHAGVGGAT